MNFEQILIELSWQRDGQRLDPWLNSCSRSGAGIHPLAIWPSPLRAPEGGMGAHMKTQGLTRETRGTAWRKLESQSLILAGKGWDCWCQYSPTARSASASRSWRTREDCFQASLNPLPRCPNQYIPVDLRSICLLNWLSCIFWLRKRQSLENGG